MRKEARAVDEQAERRLQKKLNNNQNKEYKELLAQDEMIDNQNEELKMKVVD